MKIIFELNLEENFSAPEKISNIDIAKAMTEVDFLNEADLCEIAKYLLVYTEVISSARSTEKLCAFHSEKAQKAVTV